MDYNLFFNRRTFSFLTRFLLVFFLFSSLSCKQDKSELEINFELLSTEEKRLPENALHSMVLADGLDIELFASEPMIANPTNMAVDARGRVWICEGRNYRLFANPNNPYEEKGDRILILEDTNGDGKADTSKVFYQGEDINSALGIVVLGNKVIISASPNIFVFTDEDQDDIPDSKEVLFTGIEGIDHDHGAHAFVFGPDGRLYFNYGNSGQHLLDRNNLPITDVNGTLIDNTGKPYREGMAFRSELDGTGLEVLGHNFRNPYELAVDSYGGVWQTDNDDDGNRGVRLNYLLESGNYGYKDKITGANWRERRAGWSDSIPLRHWHTNDPGTVPNLLQTGSGSPCGLIVYEDDMLPENYKGNLIHCEPGHNVVRSYIVNEDGAGYKAHIKNMVQSKDDWFRPDDVTISTDGSLFISDWYDGGVGGHKAEDVGRGRVYRLSSGKKYAPVKFDFSTGRGAVEGLVSGNMDAFYQSWQKLHEMGHDAEPFLKELIKIGGTAKAKALWLAAKNTTLANEYIKKALTDFDPKFRMQGIRMARYVFRDQLENYVSMVINDSSARVRAEAAIALKDLGTEAAASLWAKLAMQHNAGDRWGLESLGIGADRYPDLYFNKWKSQVVDQWKTPAGYEIVWRINSQESVPLLVELIKDKNTPVDKIPIYFRAFHFKEHPLKNELLLSMLDAEHPHEKVVQAYSIGEMDSDFVNGSMKNLNLVKTILPSIEGTPEWLTAIRKLKILGQDKALLNLVTSNESIELRKEAANLLFNLGGLRYISEYFKSEKPVVNKVELINVLGGVNNRSAINFLKEVLLDNNIALPIQRKVVESLGNSSQGQHILYNLLVGEKLIGELKTSTAIKLMASTKKEISENVFKYLPSDNRERDISNLVKMKGNPLKGKVIYANFCASCHVADGEGIDFGPTLSDIGNKLSKEFLYSSIIYPSAGINFGYEGHIVSLESGATLVGYIIGDTENELTLKTMGSTINEIDKKSILKIEEMTKSLMPEGLDKVMEEKDLVDLIAYLETLKV